MRKIGCSTYHVSSDDVTDDIPRIAVKYVKKKGLVDAKLGLDVKHYLYERSVNQTDPTCELPKGNTKLLREIH
jgi:hypothetical protein